MHAIHKQTYGTQITEYIKQCILDGEYGPGEKVNEVDIASRLKVSRAPVREALQYLAQTGLLVSIPQKGKFIAALTAKEIQDSYFTGGVLEGAAASSTIHLFTDGDFAAMDKLVQEMGRLGSVPDSREAMAELDNEFHERIFSHSANTLLRELSRRSCQGISKFLLYRYWRDAFVPGEMHGRHKAVLEALTSRDPVRIESAIREHYREAGQRMARYGVETALHF
ncbi:GntR family transcriptional regulator [Desulfovibrio sp. OttesenSCG-928-O18]|nr:GntR family transcriptional regulator [Desulfovibrio sp. OttesenSCG-928-O18]